MGLNNIQLPAQTIVDLYKNLLCEDDSVSTPGKLKNHNTAEINTVKQDNVQSIATGQINFLGKNLMQLVMLVDYNSEVYLPENQLNFISNILKACKMNLADVAIVNVNKQPISLERLSQQLNPKYLVLFGIDSSILDFHTQLTAFNIITSNDIQVFAAPALEQLNQDGDEGKLLKSKLWLCMKKMLNL